MAAIALVESGRPDAAGTARPWPWTINAEGKGMFFASKAEAIATVRLLQANGMRSIDVGCMQVNLMHHPDAFASLDEAFDPRRNALYAARFLGQLFQQSKNWLAAAGLYHSATPALALDYVKAVAAVLRPGTASRFAAAETPVRAEGAVRTTPVIGRDGTIIPSVRLTSAGLVGQSGGRPTAAITPKLMLSRWTPTGNRIRSNGS